MKKSIKINAILNVVRTLMKIIFPLITFPYISRVIGATNYGKVNFGSSIINFFLLIASLGITTYAIREGSKLRNDKEKFEIFASQMFTINIITSVISYVTLLVVYLFWPKLSDYSMLILVQSFIIVSTALGVEWIYSIYEDYLYITIRGIFVQILSLILLFVLVKNENDYLMYAAVIVFANGGANLYNFYRAKKNINIHLVKKMNLFAHLKPMIILFFSNLTISLYVDSDTIMLGTMHNNYVVGIYSMAGKVYSILKQIIAAVITVVLPRLALYKGNNNEAYVKLIEKLTCLMILLTVPLSVGVSLLSEEIIMIVSGADNIGAAIPLSILSIAIPFSALSIIYGNGVLLINNGENKILISTLIGAVINIGLNLSLIPSFAENAAAFTTLTSEIIVVLINYHFAKKYLKLSSKGIQKALIEVAIESTFIILIIVCVRIFISNLWLTLIISGTLSLIVYIIILHIFKEELYVTTILQIKNKFHRRSIDA